MSLPDSEDDSELLRACFFPRREARIAAVTSLISTKSLLPQSPKQRQARIVEGDMRFRVKKSRCRPCEKRRSTAVDVAYKHN